MMANANAATGTAGMTSAVVHAKDSRLIAPYQVNEPMKYTKAPVNSTVDKTSGAANAASDLRSTANRSASSARPAYTYRAPVISRGVSGGMTPSDKMCEL